MRVLFLTLSIFFLSASDTYAKVVINEFSPVPSERYDWVELYAVEDTDISGWKLSDKKGVLETFEPGTFLTEGAYKSITKYQRLDNGGDTVYLYDASNKLVDSIAYGGEGEVCIPKSTGSIARIPDGGNTIEALLNSTKDQSNGNLVTDPCPTPTPKPTNTPTPTSIPKPTDTPIPTKKSSPTPKPTAKPEVKAITTGAIDEAEPTKLNEENKDLIGSSYINTQGSPTPTPQVKGATTGRFPLTAGFLIGLGLIFMGVSVFAVLRNKKKSYDILRGLKSADSSKACLRRQGG